MEPYTWRVFVEIKSGFSPVSILWYAAHSYREAFDYLETRKHLVNKKRRVFVKQQGSKHHHYHFDEQFAAALEVEDVDADEYYSEPTIEDRVSAQIHQADKHHPVTRVIWRGLAGGRTVHNPQRGSEDAGAMSTPLLPF